MKSLDDIYLKLLLDFRDLLREVMASNVGINRKVGENTLTDSQIFDKIEQGYILNDKYGAFVMIYVNDYIESIEEGRPKKLPKVPFDDLLLWLSKNGLPTDNKTLYSIQNGIYKDGIMGRPVIATLFEIIEEKIDKWADDSWDVLGDNIWEKEIVPLFDKIMINYKK